MGIPGFFSWLSRSCPAMLSSPSAGGEEFDCVYVDLNSVVHSAAPPGTCGDDILPSVIGYLSVLFETVRPRRLLFVARDGDSPAAKANSQARSFVSKVGEASSDAARVDAGRRRKWERLTEAVQEYVHGRMNEDKGWQGGLRVVISPPEAAGEGEHKIAEFVRRQRACGRSAWDPNMSHCWVGSDADLIMLALTTHEPRTRVLRETVESRRDAPKFCLVDLGVLREWLEHDLLRPRRQGRVTWDFERALDDWVCLGCLLGNDFLPHVPSLDVRENTMGLLSEVYMSVLPTLDDYVSNAGDLSVPRLLEVLRPIAKLERWIFRASQQPREADQVRLGEQGYSQRYYASCMNHKATAKEIRELCLQYVSGVSWVSLYYFQGCPTWSYFFPSRSAPLVEDLVEMLAPQAEDARAEVARAVEEHQRAVMAPATSKAKAKDATMNTEVKLILVADKNTSNDGALPTGFPAGETAPIPLSKLPATIAQPAGQRAQSFYFSLPSRTSGKPILSGLLYGAELPPQKLASQDLRSSSRPGSLAELERLSKGLMPVTDPAEILFQEECWDKVWDELAKQGVEPDFGEVAWEVRRRWQSLAPGSEERDNLERKAADAGFVSPVLWEQKSVAPARKRSEPTPSLSVAEPEEEAKPAKRRAVDQNVPDEKQVSEVVCKAATPRGGGTSSRRGAKSTRESKQAAASPAALDSSWLQAKLGRRSSVSQ